jgi:hypothetical protein
MYTKMHWCEALEAPSSLYEFQTAILLLMLENLNGEWEMQQNFAAFKEEFVSSAFYALRCNLETVVVMPNELFATSITSDSDFRA